MAGKFIIYQLLLRVFGNTNENCISGGSLLLNGSGKFDSITPQVLESLKKLSVTHVWYTGVIEHATKTSFGEFGIKKDSPAVVKGEAGSPYAIKDYYDVNPALATSVPDRMREFEALIKRTHEAGLKVVLDFVPNHLAREYHSDAKPAGRIDFGASDDVNSAFSPANNFYYLPGQTLDLSGVCSEGSLSGNDYTEFPARVTGNDCFSARPGVNDWYETVKLNYGVDYLNGASRHFEPRPKTWEMMRDVLLFWGEKGVDGFRCDMAEMVPVAFWQWAVAAVKEKYPSVLFIAEVYNPLLYPSYLKEGGFDYLYDKVGLYDNLKAISQSCTDTVVKGNHPFSQAHTITGNWQVLGDLQPFMLNFLENHDEQRIASDFNLGDPFKALPELAVSLLLNTAPFMLYFGQEFGEKGMLQEGFSGRDGRTSIFDYCSAPAVVRYLKSLAFLDGIPDGRNFLSPDEYALYLEYKKLLAIAMGEEAVRNGYTYDLEYVNKNEPGFNPACQFVFARRSRKTIDNYQVRDTLILIAVDFSQSAREIRTVLPQHLFDLWTLPVGTFKAADLLDKTFFPLSLIPDEHVILPLNRYGISIVKISI